MAHLKIALLQIAPTGSLEGNLHKGINVCREAKAMGADIALFPEMYNGYDIYNTPAEAWVKGAVAANGEFVTKFGILAGELQMAIGITYLEQCPTGPKNAFALFDRHG